MLIQVLISTMPFFGEHPIAERMVVAPLVEELPDVAIAARNQTTVDESVESRLFQMLDH